MLLAATGTFRLAGLGCSCPLGYGVFELLEAAAAAAATAAAAAAAAAAVATARSAGSPKGSDTMLSGVICVVFDRCGGPGT